MSGQHVGRHDEFISTGIGPASIGHGKFPGNYFVVSFPKLNAGANIVPFWNYFAEMNRKETSQMIAKRIRFPSFIAGNSLIPDGIL
ncbi:MAG TPA: hypothetical protein PLJ84_04705 [Bacteroidales bacterium]|nr:hypothetical protein [Bacteroidales bacterium]